MTSKIDLSSCRLDYGETNVILHIEFEPEKGFRGRMASVFHKLDLAEQEFLNLDGSRITADLCDLYDLVNRSDIAYYNTIKCLKYTLQQLYPVIFG